MMQHTPGPWEFNGPVFRDSHALRRYPSMPKKYYEIGRGEIDFPPAIACAAKETDARLIAAAPDLLQACKALLEAADGDSDMQEAYFVSLGQAMVLARAAIAKATGGTP